MPKIIKKYTKEEEELIFNNSKMKKNKLSYEELAKMLNRTVEGVRKKELDLKRKHLYNNRVDDSKWTEEEENSIREYLKKGDFTVTGLCRLFKKDNPVIEAKALEISIELRKKGKTFSYWTEEEMEYLKKWYGIERPIVMGIYLGRSLESLHQKAKKMKLGNKKIYYTARECSMLLGITDSTFISYIYKGYVKARKAVTEQLIHQVKIDDLYSFMENHQDKWDSRNLSYNPFLINQPDWFIEKCRRDRANPIGYLANYKRWTDKDFKTLCDMREQGHSFEEIAKHLERTVASVESRWQKRNTVKREKELKAIKQKQEETLKRLIGEMENEKAYLQRKVYKMSFYNFTEDDIEFISNLRMIGYKSNEIGDLVGRTGESIRQVFKRCKNAEYVVDIKPVELTKEEKEDLFNKANEGYSIYDLCLEFNKKYPDIIKCYEEQLRPNASNDGYWTEEECNTLIKLKSQGLSNKVIAYKMGKTSSSVKSKYYILTKKCK